MDPLHFYNYHLNENVDNKQKKAAAKASTGVVSAIRSSERKIYEIDPDLRAEKMAAVTVSVQEEAVQEAEYKEREKKFTKFSLRDKIPLFIFVDNCKDFKEPYINLGYTTTKYIKRYTKYNDYYKEFPYSAGICISKNNDKKNGFQRLRKTECSNKTAKKVIDENIKQIEQILNNNHYDIILYQNLEKKIDRKKLIYKLKLWGPKKNHHKDTKNDYRKKMFGSRYFNVSSEILKYITNKLYDLAYTKKKEIRPISIIGKEVSSWIPFKNKYTRYDDISIIADAVIPTIHSKRGEPMPGHSVAANLFGTLLKNRKDTNLTKKQFVERYAKIASKATVSAIRSSERKIHEIDPNLRSKKMAAVTVSAQEEAVKEVEHEEQRGEEAVTGKKKLPRSVSLTRLDIHYTL